MTTDKIKNKKTRLQKIALHEVKNKERKENQANLKSAYLQDRDSLPLRDIMSKLSSFADFHIQVAKDGVGYRKTGRTLDNGTEETEVYFLTNNERVRELDRAVGNEEILNYIKRQIEP